MKDTARVLKFKGKELKTGRDCAAVFSATMSDLDAGDITPGEARKIMAEVHRMWKRASSGRSAAAIALKGLVTWWRVQRKKQRRSKA